MNERIIGKGNFRDSIGAKAPVVYLPINHDLKVVAIDQ
jgi:hypothetical protein